MTATLSLKVVPGASRERVVGRLGDAWKVQVAAPPEGGRANEAVTALLADALGVRPAQVRILRGHTRGRKVVEVEGVNQADAEARLAASV